ncbi:unnamed protein product [Closterium sp. NIES-64]|nr:unnamed protein product [Closterium sp. NIES-64]
MEVDVPAEVVVLTALVDGEEDEVVVFRVLTALVDGEEDEVVVFRGFSSSLVLPTPSDPSDPVLPASAAISSVDRVRGPFNPARMEYIQQGMRWEEFEQLLEGMHL